MQGITEQTLPTTSQQPKSPTKVDLRSVFPAIPFTVMKVAVEDGGEIPVPPGRFLAAQEEVLSWVITNNSDEPITVALTKFKKKSHFLLTANADQPAEDYLEWIGSRKIKLEGHQTGHVHARVTRKPDHLIDSLSYTIEVRSLSSRYFAWDYDPDGDIKP